MDGDLTWITNSESLFEEEIQLRAKCRRILMEKKSRTVGSQKAELFCRWLWLWLSEPRILGEDENERINFFGRVGDRYGTKVLCYLYLCTQLPNSKSYSLKVLIKTILYVDVNTSTCVKILCMK